jgi:chromate transporter
VSDRTRTRELATLFLKLGVIGFGGPLAHIAMMRREVVQRRAWLSDAEFLEWVGACNLIPGPNSTELAIHLGHERDGLRGLLVAGLCFIAPAVVIVSALAWLYEQHGTDPAVADLRYGVLPVILAIVAQAVVGLSRSGITTPFRGALAVGAFAAYLADANELVILAAAGVIAAAWTNRGRLWPPGGGGLLGLAPFVATGHGAISLPRLFLVFLEIGSVLYGSGYVLLAFLQRNLVDGLGWITQRQLLDAVTVGQITPGPVFSTATFIGWQIKGPAGAAVATLGIFAPSFLLVAALGPIVAWVRRHTTARAVLDGVTMASLGLMAGVLVDLFDAAISDTASAAIALGALVVLVRTRLGSVWLVAGGVIIGGVHALLS